MKKIVCLLSAICCLGSSAFAQVSPAARSSSNPIAVQGLQYAFRYSQSALIANQFPTVQTSNVSASIEYANRTQETPFNMRYTGGYIWNLAGPDYQSGQFHRMYLSQGLSSRRWNFFVYDDVAYLPQSPTTGFSGIPGTGEVIGGQNPVTSPSQSILTLNTHVLNNEAHGELERAVNYATLFNVAASTVLLHFPDGNGIDTRSENYSGLLGRRLNARTSIVGRYAFANYAYSGTTVAMHTNTAEFGIRRRVTRNFTINGFAGPEWISSTVSTQIPAQLGYAVDVQASYNLRSNSFSANYAHGTNGGSGYLIGGTLDNASGNYLHQFGRTVSVGLTAGYDRTAAFNNNGVTNAIFGATQATWQLRRNMLVFANYTGRTQSSTSTLPSNVLNYTLHTISFGFGITSPERRGRP